MALKFISNHNIPNFIALSSDIENNSISGCSIVGATVFMTDTYEWYIVKEDLTLEQYGLPISVAGDISIGIVNQGSTGNESWPVSISETYAKVQVGLNKYSHVVSDDSHFHVHNGTLWSASYINTNLSSLGTVIIAVVNGSKHTHIKIEHASVGGGRIDFYRNCVFSGGTSIPVINHDLSISPSAGNPDITFSLNPTVSTEGSIFRSLLIAGGGSGANKTGGGSPFSEEFILPPLSQAYMKYTNLDGNNGMYGTTIRFYEA